MGSDRAVADLIVDKLRYNLDIKKGNCGFWGGSVPRPVVGFSRCKPYRVEMTHGVIIHCHVTPAALRPCAADRQARLEGTETLRS